MKVLYLDKVHPALEERLRDHGISSEHCLEQGKAYVESIVEDYDGIVIRSRIPIDRTLLERADRLKFIARAGAGLENIDTGACSERGVKVFHAPEGNRDAVGEHAVGMILSLFNHLCKGDREVRNGIWDREGNRGIELGERNVGIIGYGNTGQAFARKLRGFGCRIMAYDKYKEEEEGPGVERVSLETLKREADLVSFHVPLTEETHYYFGPEFLEGMRSPFYLVNTSRGRVLDTEALIQGLREGKLLGACLDVMEYEKSSFEGLREEEVPIAYRQLMEDEKVLLSPHVAGWTEASHRRLSEVLAEKILKWKEGRG
jgi:D-3-phosphoglycerate dehydrogenase